MQAKDVMTSPVVTVSPDTEVQDIAKLLLEKHISAVPVVDSSGGMVGIVSEGDLISHVASGNTGRRRGSWWLDFFSSPNERAQSYVKHHGRFAREVMTREVVTVTEDTQLPEIARILESRRIKRVPVVRGGEVVGIISRANLLQGLAAARPHVAQSAGDAELREAIAAALDEAGVRSTFLNVVVSDGVAHLWGAAESREELEALRVVLENVEGLKGVESHVTLMSSRVARSMGAV